MSRIGKRVINIPTDVTITLNKNILNIKGSKGELSMTIDENFEIKIEDNQLELISKNKNNKSLYGTLNSHILNMINGVTTGYSKILETIGVGYRFALKGNQIVIAAGFSHPVEIDVPEGITVEVPNNTQLIIKGIDKQLVGEFAANIRKIRKPEPYKGKGIRYKDEYILRKAGKKAAK